jgi:subtilisin family serine protease
VTLVAVRVLDNSGSGTTSGVIGGIEYVANMSLGGGFSQALNDAVTAAAGGVLFALAAGNESTDASTRSPASAEHPNLYTVSAIGQDDCLASFSNFGSPVDVAAPGVGVLSTKKGGGTTTFNGTSMAAPHVAGLLLLGTLG